MPFVTTRFSSDAAATTSPPGQTQNENTPRPFSVWQESLYDVGGRPQRPAASLYCAKSMSRWRCSMRTPTAKGLGSIGTPRFCSISNVSRALWPGASTTCFVGSVYSPSGALTRSAVTLPLFCSISTTLWENRTSPPRSMISRRRFCSTTYNLSVPTWGLASTKISSLAPKRTNSSKI